jgi:hypothetical protein
MAARLVCGVARPAFTGGTFTLKEMRLPAHNALNLRKIKFKKLKKILNLRQKF